MLMGPPSNTIPYKFSGRNPMHKTRKKVYTDPYQTWSLAGQERGRGIPLPSDPYPIICPQLGGEG